jgi:hypothetical protein
MSGHHHRDSKTEIEKKLDDFVHAAYAKFNLTDEMSMSKEHAQIYF